MPRASHLTGAASFPLPALAIGFRPEFLDFKRGIRVGNLEDHERITRILKLALEARYGEPFVTERWGRGVHWRWIGYLTRSNRAAKPLSGKVSFGCAKFFLEMDTAEQLFKCGMQVERGLVKTTPDTRAMQLREDWDWHRLMAGLNADGSMEKELRRLLLREGFRLHAGAWDASMEYSKTNLPSMTQLRRVLAAALVRQWAGFVVYYAMTEEEVTASAGLDLIEAILAVFAEVAPLMNLCTQTTLARPR